MVDLHGRRLGAAVTRLLSLAGGIAVATVALAAVHAIGRVDEALAAGKVAPPATSSSLTTPPALARVRFDLTPGGAAITHDLIFSADSLHVVRPRADAGGDGALYVAFTGQARPLAIEATLHTLDAQRAIVEAGAIKLSISDVSARPPTSALVLGAPRFAGHVVHLPASAETSGAFGVRIRSAIATSVPDGARDVTLLARLGVRAGAPIVLEKIEVAGALGVTVRGARATLCGGAGDDRPLTLVFPGYPASTTDAGTIDPATARRGEGDDLCVNVMF